MTGRGHCVLGGCRQGSAFLSTNAPPVQVCKPSLLPSVLFLQRRAGPRVRTHRNFLRRQFPILPAQLGLSVPELHSTWGGLDQSNEKYNVGPDVASDHWLVLLPTTSPGDGCVREGGNRSEGEGRGGGRHALCTCTQVWENRRLKHERINLTLWGCLAFKKMPGLQDQAG